MANDLICDEFFLCKALALTKKGADIFKIIDESFKKKILPGQR